MSQRPGIAADSVMSLPAFAPRRGRMALCVLAAVSIHLIAVLNIDLPRGAPSALPAVIELKLAAAPALPEPVVEVPDRSEPVAETLPHAPPGPSAVSPPRPLPAEPREPVETAQPDVPPDALAGRTVSDLAREIASLDSGRREPTDSRTRRVGHVAQADTDLAYYLESWRRKIERIGRINYPAKARTKGLTGTLLLLVSIAADGTLVDVRVLEPSGHDVLDEAAVRIVELGAPYSPFPPRLRDSTDLLEIERTWQFRGDRLSWQ